MKPERILPAWRCPEHKSNVYTEPGKCSKCNLRLKKFTPVSDLPHVFRCKTCRGVFLEEPKKKQGHLWLCPACETPTISAWGCEEEYLEKIKAKQTPAPEPEKTKAPFQFAGTVKKAFQINNAVSRAAFRAQQLAERLSQRRPQDGDAKGYIDAVEFDIARFNMRAQMVADMVLVKSLLEEAGLSEYVDSALNRILDSRLGLHLERRPKQSKKTKE
jgi:hypothetical protein